MAELPYSLRATGPSPSHTPRPEQQVDMQASNKPQYATFQAQQGQPGPAQEFSSGQRFPSAQYQEESSTQNVFQPPRSTAGQSYIQEQPSMSPVMQSPPATQQLFAQHSGTTAPGAGPSGSRPQSRHASAMNTAALQAGYQAQLAARPGTSSGAAGQPKSPFSTPVTSPPRGRPSSILLINPTSSSALTANLLANLRPILPPQLEVVGYTAQYPAPMATETTVDMALSTELVLRDLAKYATNNGETVKNFDALLVASFTSHPLVNALRESYDVPVIGVLEGSLYVSRMLGARFGILATTNRHKIQQDDAIHTSGLTHYFVGSEAVHMSPIEVLTASSQQATGPLPDEMVKRISYAARALVARGADTLIMGSECFCSQEVIRIAKDAVRDEDGRRAVNVVDCVEAGVMCLNALVGMGVPTSKKGLYRGEREGRRTRGQTWL